MAEVNMDVKEIMKYLPHRFPFLLVDKIVELDEEAGKIVGIKQVSINEWFFQGHFPNYPIMPGVLIIEALAQTAGVLALKKKIDAGEKAEAVFFAAIEEAKFRNPVFPGDTLRLEVEIIKMSGRFAKFKGIAKVGDKIAVEAVMLAAV